MSTAWRYLGLLGVFAVSYVACTQAENSTLQGTWRMESGIYTEKQTGQKIVTEEVERFCLKIMGADHFAVVEMFTNQPDSLFFAAVGTYSLKGDRYIEKYDASNVGYQVGTTREFSSTLEGNKWTLASSEHEMELLETWVKVKQR